jgi:hypothetical protein
MSNISLTEFIERYDHEGAIVLLEGKRKVKGEDQEKLSRLGKMLAEKTTHILFRSGNAEGSDAFFSKGVCSVDAKKLQVITPYTNHRAQQNLAFETIALDQLDLEQEQEVIEASVINKKNKNMIRQYLKGEHKMLKIKGAYLIRDTIKAIGTRKIKPASFGVFYDDLEEPKSGGTGHTMMICESNNIPFVDQRPWFGWLEE